MRKWFAMHCLSNPAVHINTGNTHFNRQGKPNRSCLSFLSVLFISDKPFTHELKKKKMNKWMNEKHWQPCAAFYLAETISLNLLLLENVFICFSISNMDWHRSKNKTREKKNPLIFLRRWPRWVLTKKKKKSRLCTSSDASVMQSGEKEASVCHQKYCKSARRKKMWNKRCEDTKRTAPT